MTQVPDHAIDAAFDDAGHQIVSAFELVLHRAAENGVELTLEDHQAIRDRLAWIDATGVMMPLQGKDATAIVDMIQALDETAHPIGCHPDNAWSVEEATAENIIGACAEDLLCRVGLVRDQGGRFLILDNPIGYSGYFFQAGEFWAVLIPKHCQHE